MSDLEWDVLAAALGLAPQHDVTEPPGIRGRLHRARRQVRRARNIARYEFAYRTAVAKHRWLRRHTFVESQLIDLHLGCVQYRGLHCLVCDAPAGW